MKRKLRKVNQRANYSVRKRQVRDIFHASDREQCEYFSGLDTQEPHDIQSLLERLNRPVIADAIASGKLKIVAYDVFDDANGMYDDD